METLPRSRQYLPHERIFTPIRSVRIIYVRFDLSGLSRPHKSVYQILDRVQRDLGGHCLFDMFISFLRVTGIVVGPGQGIMSLCEVRINLDASDPFFNCFISQPLKGVDAAHSKSSRCIIRVLLQALLKFIPGEIYLISSKIGESSLETFHTRGNVTFAIHVDSIYLYIYLKI